MNKKTISIIFGVILLLIITIGSIIFGIKKWEREKEFNTPEEVSKAYFEYINQAKYDKAYELVNPQCKQAISFEDFKNAYSSFYEGIGLEAIKTDNFNYNKQDTYNSKITYTNTIRTIYGEIKFENLIELKKLDDKKYYIDWNYSTIYPELEKEDEIEVIVDEAKRGNLIDRNGVLLAGSGYVASIGIVPGWMNQDTKQQDIVKISELLGISVENINKKMNASYVKSDTFVELDTISKQDLQILSALREIDGIKIKDIESRVYPLGEKAAHITGYVQKANKEDIEKNKKYDENTLIGRAGLEKAYDSRLRGENGYSILLVNKNNDAKKIEVLKTKKVDGANIKLTIDANIQSTVYDIYAEDNSATVIMYPGTGELLALISTPSYDPNKFVIGMSSQEWNELNNNPNNPMYTRFLKSYAPGSSFKPVIGAIALETNTINSYDEFEPSGSSWQKDSSWGSYYITTLKTYNEPATLQNALINSDNIYFAKTALKIGAQKLEEQLKAIGFESELEFDLETKKSQISNEGKFTSEIQLADSGYGQGQILINPIHYASIYGIFANGGNMVKPNIEISENTETTFIKEHAFSKKVTDIIKEDLIQTIENPEGTAHLAKIEGLKLAGKTGTAETKSTKEEDAKEIGWFNAFIADESNAKQYVVISMVENVENKGGSQYVVNKVKKIFEKI